MSRWAQGSPPMNSRRNAAANRPPPQRTPSCWSRSAILLGCGPARPSRRGSASATVPRRRRRPAASTVADHVVASPSRRRPCRRARPRMCPVRVATSTIRSGFCSVARDQRVGEHQPPLGVGVEHLDGGAAVHGEHVAGPHRRAGHHVLGHRGERGDLDRQPEPRDRERRLRRPRRRRPCRTSSSFMPDAGLMVRPPESKVMPLPTSARWATGAVGRVGQLDQPRRRARSPRRRRGCRRSPASASAFSS